MALEFVPGIGFRRPGDGGNMDKAARRISLRPGETIFRAGDPPGFAYVLIEGDVQIVAWNRQGNPEVVAEIPRGALFGELALITGQPRSASARTSRGCSLLAVSKADLAQLAGRADPVLKYWLTYLCQRLIVMSDRLAERGP